MTVAVVACSSRDRPTNDLPEGVYAYPDLCSHPRLPRELVDGADGLVLVVHGEDIEISRLQGAIRKAGFDPFGVPLVDLAGARGEPQRLAVMVAGASARAAAYEGSRPEQARPMMAKEMSRRALLSIPRPYYVPVPSIDPSTCGSEDGCRACVDLCPQRAYRLAGRKITFDKQACVGCGLCVTGCPTGAIDEPTISAASVKAEIEAIVGSTDEVGIVFTCRESTERVTVPDWYEVLVPCTAMVPATWPVAAVMLGAAAATVRSCRDGGCPLALDERSAAAMELARSLAAAAGLGRAALPDEPSDLPERRGQSVPLADPFGLHGAAEVALGLGSSQALDLESEMSPLGIIDIDANACTLCTLCSQTCPTGALETSYSEGLITLSFDAALCTACAQCLSVCPERDRTAIALSRRIDSVALAVGRVTVHEAETVACERCGRHIAPAATLDRIAALLGEDHVETARYVASRCMDCRGID